VKILAINQFYAPDSAATAQLLAQLCEDLVTQGDEVTVIASRGTYSGGERLAACDTIAGVNVVRPWATSLGKATIGHRLSDYVSFWVGAVSAAVRARRPEVMLVLSTPPMIAVGAALVSAARQIPLVSWVHDVYPEIAVAFGLLGEHHPAITALRAMSRVSQPAVHTHVALAEDMALRLGAQGIAPSRIRVVHNWADGAVLAPVPRANNRFLDEHGLRDRFVVMYSGNLGVGHDLQTFVDAARQLAASHPRVVFVFVGGGARRAETEQATASIPNVRFLPAQPRAQLAESLSAADAHLVSLRDGFEGLLVPSKLYSIMAVGRPILYVGPASSEVARVVNTHRLGWAGQPGDAHGLADAIAALVTDDARRAATGAAARQTLEAEFDRTRAVAKWREVLQQAAFSTHDSRVMNTPRDERN